MGGVVGEDNNVHVTAFGDHAQNAGIYSIFASLYNKLRKDVEQDTLSQASMPLATMPETLACTAFLLLCTTYNASSVSLCEIIRKTATAQEAYQTFKNYFVIFDTRSCLMRVFVGPASTVGTL